MFKNIHEAEQFGREEKQKDISLKYSVATYWTSLVISLIAIVISLISLYFSMIK